MFSFRVCDFSRMSAGAGSASAAAADAEDPGVAAGAIVADGGVPDLGKKSHWDEEFTNALEAFKETGDAGWVLRRAP